MTERSTRCHAAYLRCLPALRALEPGELREVDLEVDAAVTTILNALPLIKRLRILFGVLGNVEMEVVDNLESYALAALYTHFRHAAQVPRNVDELLEAAREERAALCHAALALPAKARIANSEPESAEALAHDMLRRAELARAYLHEVEPEREDLHETLEIVTEVELLAEEILADLAAPYQRGSTEELSDERRRAFTLCMVAYEDKVRPAVDEVFRRKDELETLGLAYAFQKVAEEMGPEALSLLGPDRGSFGAN